MATANPIVLMIDGYDSEGYLVDSYTSHHSTEAEARQAIIPALDRREDVLNATVYMDHCYTDERLMQATDYTIRAGVWSPR